jgi:hypothetical protein
MFHGTVARGVALALILLSVIGASGCASGPKPHWRAGVLPLVENPTRPARKPEDVKVYFKRAFGALEPMRGQRAFACDSVTLLRRSELVPGREAKDPPPHGRRVAELTTEEFPRDDEKSRIEDASFTNVLGFGTDLHDLYRVVPSEAAIERGIARLQELAAQLGADSVEDVYMTTYAEFQMWEGWAISLNPRSTWSPFFSQGRLLDFKLRDVRFHGAAVIHEE